VGVNSNDPKQIGSSKIGDDRAGDDDVSDDAAGVIETADVVL
jgi:hypothetical protein